MGRKKAGGQSQTEPKVTKKSWDQTQQNGQVRRRSSKTKAVAHHIPHYQDKKRCVLI